MEPGGLARRCACARASRHRDGAPRRSRSSKGSLAKSDPRLWPERGRGPGKVCVAEAEIALVSRDLGWPAKALEAARATLEERGDRVNAAHARSLEGRRLPPI